MANEITEFNDKRKEMFEDLVKKGMTKKEAAIFSGYSPGYVPSERPSKEIKEALQNQGITHEKIAKAFEAGLEAKTRWGTADHNAITKYLSMLGKWLGYEKDNVNLSIGLNIKGQVTDQSKLKEAINIVEAELVNRDGFQTESKESQ